VAVKLSVNDFKSTLAAETKRVAEEYGLDLAQETGRGRAFQYWAGELILATEDNIEGDLIESAFYSKDLGTDLVFEDEANKYMLICQCKFVTPQKPVESSEVNDFFNRHDLYMDRKWVQKYGSEYVASALAEYPDRVADGWKIEFRFLTTGNASEAVNDLSAISTEVYSERSLGIECSLYDFSTLKDYYVRSLSLEESVPEKIEMDLPANQFFIKSDPHRTVIAVLKGNALRDLYRQNKQSLYGRFGFQRGVMVASRSQLGLPA
jgi:hypothetical protein